MAEICSDNNLCWECNKLILLVNSRRIELVSPEVNINESNSNQFD
ncbi:hypothetical protein BVRB_3g063970 [Beta vulgaris subsp. vulgaris]|nr:hypothetical protein BVRB_3g063970 [Beta vulgaris subsp. vulgaris]